MIDPLQRWKALGLPDKPDYAGLLTFGGAPYTQDARDLDGVDVAIVGAPTDDLVSDRSGTRFGPRAIRAAGCPSGIGAPKQVYTGLTSKTALENGRYGFQFILDGRPHVLGSVTRKC